MFVLKITTYVQVIADFAGYSAISKEFPYPASYKSLYIL